MDPHRPGSRWFDLSWLLFWAVASSLWCLTASSRLSSTFDEPFYVESGLHAWHAGSYRPLLRAGTMPLPVDVETLPLYIWEQCRGKPFDKVADFERILPARAANLLFWWVLLFYGFCLGRFFGGPWGGRLAVVFLACEPNLLAHAALATMDIAVSASLLAFIYHYQAGREGNWRRRVGIPGLCYGIAMLSKASALAFGPVAMFALEHARQWSLVCARCRSEASLHERLSMYWRSSGLFPKDFWKIIGLGFLITFLYCGSDWQRERTFVVWAEKLPEGPLRNAMVPVADHLRIFPNAGSGLVYQIKHNIRGHGAYLFGNWYPRSVPFYFPAALLIKLTIPVLALSFLLIIIRPRSLATPLGLLVLVLLAFSLSCRVQIGIRLVLPLVSVWMIALGVGLVRASLCASTRSGEPGTSATGVESWQTPAPDAPGAPCSIALLLILLGLLIIPPLSVWPDGLRHVNPVWGGTAAGYRHLSDSNYDWGQGLKELAEWRRQNDVAVLKIWYYGTEPQLMRSPENCPLQNMPIESPAEFLRIVAGSHLAVGTSILYRNPNFTPASVHAFAVLKGMQPVARTSTFFIYDFTGSTEPVRVP